MLLRKSVKFLGLFWLVLFAFSAHATNYYLSNSGNDANSGTDPSAPWQTLNKLNSFKNLKPGDSVLFKRGDTFFGSITVNNSGAARNLITFSAYGTGENPVISGFTNVISWTNLGNNIWESTNAVSGLPTCNMVVINGINTAMGRWPNNGYMTFQSHIGKTSITSSDLTKTSNWTGAEVAIRSTQWTLEREKITSQSAGTINYPATNYEPTNGFGFFIQNDIRTLDQQNEWYYSPSTKKISIYSTFRPVNIYIACQDALVTLHGNFLTFNNLSFEGANQYAFYNDWSGINNISIEYCSILFSGIDAIKLAGTSNFAITNSKISNSNNVGINLFYLNPFAIVKNNDIVNTGIFCGMGQGVSGSYSGIFSNDKGSLIQNNKIVNSGYDGIFVIGDSFMIKNNYIDTFCRILQDGGGIYTHSQKEINYGRKIINNIVLNGIGAVIGTTDSTYFAANGIYLDDNSAYIEVSGNSVGNCSNNGLFIHNGYNLNVHNNTFYNCSAQFATQNDLNQYTLRGSAFNHNIFFSKTIKQRCGYFESTTNDFSLWGSADNNFYAKPIADSLVFNTRINWGDPNLLTLDDWKSYSGLDQNSKKSPKGITDTSDLRFEINADSINKTIILPYNYIDVAGKIYNGSIILPPYSSAILIKNGPVITQPPNIDAGKDQSIILPQDSVKLLGSASDNDGKIMDYYWTKISGPSNFNIINSKSLITDVTGLTEGVYLFELTVTDNNNGATAKDTIIITVNPAGNLPPNANAGSDKTITLPVNTTILTGSATDSDGYISDYLWEKISGPSDYYIENANSTVTAVTGLTEGVYQFQLSVKDDKGASASSMVQITVNAPLNIAPTATSGANQTITLPTNTATVSGSGFDSDGTISAYSWSKIAGPPAYNISNPSSSVTTVSGLVQGVYEFELKVTDDEGAIGRDTVQITVNVARNIAPTANAGIDKTITLPTNSVSLLGSGTDPDGTIASYSWTKISGPSTYNVASPSSEIAIVSGLVQGIYLFELKVTDDKGAIGRDTVQMTVNTAANIAPTANAGSATTITLPTNSVSLSGIGTDTDGSISSYSWTKISGPLAYNITNAASAITTVSALVQGVYLFELKVTDDKGAIVRDTVQVMVNPAANIAPTANAGADQTITLPTNSVSLSGVGMDTDGAISSYSWTKISGPSTYNLAYPSSSATSLSGLVQGVYLFELKVTDDKGASASDTVQITLNAALNNAPTANAGTDKTIILPTNTINLVGTGADSDGTVVSYLWTQISVANPATITNPSSTSTSVKGLIQGNYVFKLTVTDNQGATGADSIFVTVNAAPNIPPTTNAGTDKTITLPTNSVSLFGSGTDPDGSISSYSWTKISGPSAYNISNASSAITPVSALLQGVYLFELKVTDDKGAIGRDTVQVTVKAAPNIAPTANAGVDQIITLPTNSISLSGSGTDTDGSISSYSWTKISGPSAYNISNSSSAITTVSGLVQAVYLFELKVTDDKGATGRDTVQITVNAAPNTAPMANAGADQTIRLPINTINLNGSGTDADGRIVSYLWIKIAGPAGAIVDSLSASTTAKGLIQGNYVFQLTVTDNDGAKGTDTLNVTVNNVKNIAPTANAGGDLTILLPLNTVYLNGIGNGDGTITAYQWKQIAGPDSALIVTENKASTVVKNLVAGTYEFELTVTDNNGETGRDTMMVVVALGRSSSEPNSIKVYPNPVRDIATMEITSENVNSQITLTVSNFVGKILYKRQTNSSNFKTIENINMSRFSKGAYLMTVTFDERVKQVLSVIKL